MGLNVGYLTANTSKAGDELYTPKYAVAPIMKYIPKGSRIWLPFDSEWSAYNQEFIRGGYNVIRSSIEDGQDFFTYEPKTYDLIVSNPPFSQKDKVLERLYFLGKPFAILLPLNSLQGKSRYKYFKQGIQILCFDARICFHDADHMDRTVKGSPFASAYFCRNLLPKDLIIEKLHIYEEPLINS